MSTLDDKIIIAQQNFEYAKTLRDDLKREFDNYVKAIYEERENSRKELTTLITEALGSPLTLLSIEEQRILRIPIAYLNEEELLRREMILEKLERFEKEPRNINKFEGRHKFVFWVNDNMFSVDPTDSLFEGGFNTLIGIANVKLEIPGLGVVFFPLNVEDSTKLIELTRKRDPGLVVMKDIELYQDVYALYDNYRKAERELERKENALLKLYEY
jgi:hypothetical protein